MSENIKQNKNKWQKFIFIIIGGALGILLLIFGNVLEKEDSTDASEVSETSFPHDADVYASMLETRVTEICSQISGVGEVEVFVSLKGGYRTVYAIDSQSTSSGYKNEVVMSGSGSDKKAVVTAYENPEIGGVGIVCSGRCDDITRSQIVSLVSAALGIGTNKIFVASSGK